MNRYIGIPFADGEPSLAGANCITLVELIYREKLGVPIHPIRIPHGQKNRAFMQFLTEVSERWEAIDTPEEFCVVAMAHDPRRPDLIQHFGIYLGNDIMLHTLQKVGAHTVRLSKMKSFIRGYYRWRS